MLSIIARAPWSPSCYLSIFVNLMPTKNPEVAPTLLGKKKSITLLDSHALPVRHQVSPSVENRQLMEASYLEYLSSGEKRAGCADCVGWPSYSLSVV